MTRTFALAVALTALAGPAPAAAAAGPGAKQVDEAMARALEANDLEAIVATYAEDAVFFAPGEMAQRGKTAIRKGFADLLGAYRITDFTVSDVQYTESGDVSVAHGLFSLSGTSKAGSEPVRWQGRYTLVAKRVGGKWLVVSDHASMPTGAAPNVPRAVSAPRR
jgi:uncharacterized protein (TIGR02246 family)